jgi:hypothetical protein
MIQPTSACTGFDGNEVHDGRGAISMSAITIAHLQFCQKFNLIRHPLPGRVYGRRMTAVAHSRTIQTAKSTKFPRDPTRLKAAGCTEPLSIQRRQSYQKVRRYSS